MPWSLSIFVQDRMLLQSRFFFFFPFVFFIQFNVFLKMCLVVSMILAFPLQFFPVRSISEKYVFLSDEESNFMRSMWRFSLVILIGFLGSMSKADFALVYSFVGGLFGCLIAFVLPIVFFISLEKPKGNSLGFHIFLLAFSLMVVLMSSFSSGAALVKSYLLV
jgi:hypothetical protein